MKSHVIQMSCYWKLLQRAAWLFLIWWWCSSSTCCVIFIAVYSFYASAHYYYKCLKYTDVVHDPLLDEAGWVLIYWTGKRDKLTWF